MEALTQVQLAQMLDHEGRVAVPDPGVLVVYGSNFFRLIQSRVFQSDLGISVGYGSRFSLGSEVGFPSDPDQGFSVVFGCGYFVIFDGIGILK